MTQQELGMLAIAIEASTRPQFKALLNGFTQDPQEQIQLMAAILSLQLRALHQQLGDAGLEAILRSVLMPRPDTGTSPAPPSSPGT